MKKLIVLLIILIYLQSCSIEIENPLLIKLLFSITRKGNFTPRTKEDIYNYCQKYGINANNFYYYSTEKDTNLYNYYKTLKLLRGDKRKDIFDINITYYDSLGNNIKLIVTPFCGSPDEDLTITAYNLILNGDTTTNVKFYKNDTINLFSSFPNYKNLISNSEIKTFNNKYKLYVVITCNKKKIKKFMEIYYKFQKQLKNNKNIKLLIFSTDLPQELYIKSPYKTFTKLGELIYENEVSTSQ